MTFQLTDDHVTRYWERGYTVFERIVPVSLIADLRRAVRAGLVAVGDELGERGCRFKPRADDDMPLEPFDAFVSLPALQAALGELLTPEHALGQILSVMVEPAVDTYCERWHRDWRSNISEGVFEKYLRADWDEKCADPLYFHQVNCALYDDSSMWYVPGSHVRQENLPAETRAAAIYDDYFPARPRQTVDSVERERRALDYALTMPGAVQIHLHAGDVLIYRPTGWHTETNLPYRQRATLHDHVVHPDEIRYLADREKRYERARGVETVFQ